MGGRGGSSGLHGGGGQSAIQSFKNAGVQFIETDNLDMRAVGESLNGVRDVLTDMGIPLSTVASISGKNGSAKDKDTLASVNGFSQLSFRNKNYSSLEKARQAANNENNYLAAKGLYGTGAHEAGHLVVNEIINRTMKDSSRLERSNARKNQKVEKQVLREAQKRYGSNPKISDYGSTKYAEKIAEAVSDVYTNKSKAHPYSKVIVDVLKEKLRGR